MTSEAKGKRELEVLKLAQEHFQREYPHLCIKTVEGKSVRDGYYLDHPERSGSMKSYLEGYNTAYEKVCSQLEVAKEALRFYTNYDNETARHMDTEFLQPERRAIIKLIDKIGQGYANDGLHPSQVYQDDCFTYGPKQRSGKIAREALAQLDAKEK